MIAMEPIGTARSPFTEAEQVPKGPEAEHRAEGVLELLPQSEAGLGDVEGFSHLFVLWVFHAGPELLARPPGPTAHTALTVAKLLRREGPRLYVRGVDMLDCRRVAVASLTRSGGW